MPWFLSFALLVAALPIEPAPRQSSPPTLDLMPVPRSLTLGAGRMALDTEFRVAVTGFSDARLARGVTRMLGRLGRRTALTLPAEPGGDTLSARLVIAARGPGQEIQSETEDESYSLEVTPARAVLRAATVVGVLRGIETLLQLVAADSGRFYLPVVRIEDAPRFPWRGLLVDAGRHFEPVEVIKRTLDGMAAVKLNVLHWHLSDDQGFRVESLRYPRLHGQGSDGLYYTQAQIQDVVGYARDRGIRVVPEFDMPGHTSSWFVGYPGYASGVGPYRIQRTWGVFDPALDPTREVVYSFIDSLIGEMAALFPDPYWHVGGDEVTGVEWSANRGIRDFMRRNGLADNAALQAYFNRRIGEILVGHGKRMVGWDEIIHPDLPKTAVIQSWRGTEYLGLAARQGYRGILSAPFYLDHMLSAEDHYVDPVPDTIGFTPEQAALVLGGEACMWGEHVGPETIDSRLWPRLAVVAEKLWSPAAVKDVHDMYRRLPVVSQRLEELGLGHTSHTDRMLRRAVGDGPGFKALQALLELAQPVSFGQRHRLQVGMTQQTPLTRIVDAARPDPPARWASLTLVERFLADSGRTRALGDSLRREFTRWRALSLAVQEAGVRVPFAREGRPAAAALARAGAVGLAALDRLSGAVTATQAWQDSARVILEGATGPQGLIRLVVVDAARWLVEVTPVKP
ncbi:MAG TPA: family 20 glycosylhydrolase [Gemmatimonadales bacterium]